MGKPKGAWNSPSVTAATSVDLGAYLEGNSRGAISVRMENSSKSSDRRLLSATTYGDPKSDQVAWCSAFVNWSLKRAGMQLTGSAVAQSFICYSTATSEGMAGDIAVFRKTGGTGTRDETGGHVGFHITQDASRVTMLGGNQGPDGKGSVTEETRPKSGSAQTFHSICRVI